jgi:hypothetical protein
VHPTLTRSPRRTTAVLVAITLLPLAGCGGDQGTTAASGDSLARFVPKTAPVYVEGSVRPTGDLAKNLDATIAKFAPGQTLETLLSKAFAGKKVNYETDVKPWLGERAGLAVTGLQKPPKQTDPEVAALVQTTDGKAPLDLLRRTAAGKVQDREYNGVKYLFDAPHDTAAAVEDKTLVIGTEGGFKAAIDASKGGGLDQNPNFAKVTGKVKDNAVVVAYGDVGRVLDLAKSAGSVRQLQSFRELVARQGVKEVGAGLAVTGDAVKVRVAAATPVNPDAAKAGETVAELPAGSWAALGLGDLGTSISNGLDSLRSAGTPGLDVQRGLDQLKQQAGIDVQKDFLAWIGQSGLFVRGTSLTDVGGALVVQSKDPAATKAALSKSRTIVAGAGLRPKDLSGSGIDDGFSVTAPGSTPVEIFAALAGNRFVLAVSKSALDEAIKPTGKLGDDDTYKAAAAQLGDGLKPVFLLDFPKISGLIGLAAGSQPGFSRVRPYLDKIGTVAAGSKRDGDVTIQTLSVGIR